MDRFGGRKFSNCDSSRKIFITRLFVVAFRQASFILFFESASNEPSSQLKEHSIRPHCPGVSPTQFKFNWAWKFPTCCLNSPPRVYHFHRSPPWTTSLTSKTILPAILVYHIQNQSQRRQASVSFYQHSARFRHVLSSFVCHRDLLHTIVTKVKEIAGQQYSLRLRYFLITI